MKAIIKYQFYAINKCLPLATAIYYLHTLDMISDTQVWQTENYITVTTQLVTAVNTYQLLNYTVALHC